MSTFLPAVGVPLPRGSFVLLRFTKRFTNFSLLAKFSTRSAAMALPDLSF